MRDSCFQVILIYYHFQLSEVSQEGFIQTHGASLHQRYTNEIKMQLPPDYCEPMMYHYTGRSAIPLSACVMYTHCILAVTPVGTSPFSVE